jgi:hypothetical protein
MMTFTNTLAGSEVLQSSAFILGCEKTGELADRVYLYVPYGGEITNLSSESGEDFLDFTKNAIKLYTIGNYVDLGESVSVTYDVTTSSQTSGN